MLVYYTAALIMLTAHIYCGLFKLIYRPRAYRDNFYWYFPAQKIITSFFLIHILDLPYLLNITSPAALFYSNAFRILILPAFIAPLFTCYFFHRYIPLSKIMVRIAPALAVIAFLLPFAMGWATFTPAIRLAATFTACSLGLVYTILLFSTRTKLKREVCKISEMECSNEKDFPVRFASNLLYVTIIVPILVFTAFLVDTQWAKMVCDIIFATASIVLTIYITDPYWASPEQEADLSPLKPIRRLTENRQAELLLQIEDVLRKEKLYTRPNLKIDDLAQLLLTNRNYISEAIQNSQWKSFYTLVNSLRIDCVLEKLGSNPSLTIESAAIDAGFTSASSFSQIFKKMKGIAPSTYLKIAKIHAD